MAFWDKALQRLGIKKINELSIGDDTPLPRYAYGQYISGFQSFSDLLSPYRTLDPAQANEGRDNAIVSICVNFIATSWQQAPVSVGTRDGVNYKGLEKQHPLEQLIEFPNDNYGGTQLMWSVLTDLIRKGNAYIYVTRDRTYTPIHLSWVPARWIRPIPNEQGYLSHYEYAPFGEVLKLKKEDVVHIKYGIDERLPLQGVSPLAPLYREIITDNSYSDFSAGLASSGGVPPVVFTPKILKLEGGEQAAPMTPEQADNMTRRLQEKMSREPGKPRFIPGALDMHQLGFKPDEMALNDVRSMPETRIPAALGLDPLSLGLWTGVQRATFNNKQESIKQSWRGGIIPLMKLVAYELTRKVLRTYPDSEDLWVFYDTSGILELKSDVLDSRREARADVLAGIITVDEAREEVGRELSFHEAMQSDMQSVDARTEYLATTEAPVVTPSLASTKPRSEDISRREQSSEEISIPSPSDLKKVGGSSE
jgi:HK97 family phage portal protein